MEACDSQTIDYYGRNAAAFVEATVNASMHEALDAFVDLLPAGAHVLDWGCGSGRDSQALRERGFVVTSVDGSPEMAAMALAATGTYVRVETFAELNELDVYDGIWACASLLHVPPDDLPGVFARAHAALKHCGVLYCSFKYGNAAEYRHGRWFTDLDEERLSQLLEPQFDVQRLWTSGDVREGRSDQLWLNCLATKR